MAATSPKLVVVVGATGGQGGSVISALLGRPSEYKLRAITRNAKSAKAQALADKGVEVVEADLNSEASLRAAFEGANAVYAVTDFFEPFMAVGPEKAVEVEVAQGLNLARAAAATPTLEHYVWSTLANAGQVSGGKYMIPHFVGKNRIDAFIKSQPALLAKTTFLWITYYAGNLMYPLFTPAKVSTAGDDRYIWLQPVSPNTKVTSIGSHTDNVGRFVEAILDQPEVTLPGRFVLADAEPTTTKGGLLEAWGRAVGGKKTEYVQVSLDDFDRLFPAWGREMGVMLQFWEEFGDQSWSSEPNVLTKEDLGVKNLKGIEEAFKEIQWQL